MFRIRELSSARYLLQHKIANYRNVLALIDPFKEPLASLQPNLVVRHGELAVELSKMRSLAARVNGRLGETDTIAFEDASNTPMSLDIHGTQLEIDGETFEEDERVKFNALLAP